MIRYSCLFICLFVTVLSKQCYWNLDNAYSFFGTKTPYNDVRGDIRDEAALEGCSPVGVWAIIRHGTRHPTDKDAAEMKRTMVLKDSIIRNYHEGRGEMCAQDLTNLANWTWDTPDRHIDDTIAYLTEEGHEELLQLGQRFREQFSPLLGDLDSFQFRSTGEQRTKKSAEAFLEGLGNLKFTIEESMIPDDVIRPYKTCDRFQQESANNSRFHEAASKFRKTQGYQQMLSNLRKRTGLSDLTPENATGLYKLCEYFRAYTVDRRGPWCAVFLDEDLPVLEYISDLNDYYSCGYGSLLAPKLGALPLKNLYENLEAAVNGSHRLTGYFSHDTMMQILFTTLGLYRDYPEISGLKMDPERKWRPSLMSPFASNLIVVLNKCSENDTNTYKVQTFINEKMVPLCGDLACDWTEFKEMLRPFLNGNLDFCKV